MYVPEHFSLSTETALQMLRNVNAGNLVTCHEDGPDATLVPFFLDEGGNRLVTHLVRNNPQASRPAIGQALVIVDRADAYVSPHDFATNEQMPNVPTWDYVTIHVKGRLHVDPSPAAALEAARALTLKMEDASVMEAVGDAKLERMSRAIVAVSVEIEEISAKAKMSQNRHPDDLRSLIEAWSGRGEAAELVEFLRTVSLPHAEKRYAMISELRGGKALDVRVSGSGS